MATRRLSSRLPRRSMSNPHHRHLSSLPLPSPLSSPPGTIARIRRATTRMCNNAPADGNRRAGWWEVVGHADAWPIAPVQALYQHVLLVVCRRRPFYDLSVWLSAAGVLVTAGQKPLVAVREGALVAGAAEHICALGP